MVQLGPVARASHSDVARLSDRLLITTPQTVRPALALAWGLICWLPPDRAPGVPQEQVNTEQEPASKLGPQPLRNLISEVTSCRLCHTLLVSSRSRCTRPALFERRGCTAPAQGGCAEGTHSCLPHLHSHSWSHFPAKGNALFQTLAARDPRAPWALRIPGQTCSLDPCAPWTSCSSTTLTLTHQDLEPNPHSLHQRSLCDHFRPSHGWK